LVVQQSLVCVVQSHGYYFSIDDVAPGYTSSALGAGAMQLPAG